jgi:ABC-type glycerol-3-phosphate transport system substrate-binding protein
LPPTLPRRGLLSFERSETMGWKSLPQVVVLAAPLLAFGLGTGHAADPVTIRVMDWQSGGPEFWKKTDDQFMAKNPNIKVTHEFVPYGTYFDSVGAYVASQDGPDLIQNEPGGNVFDRKDNWVPLNKFFSKDELDQITGGASLCTDFDCSKEIWGIPHTNQGHLMYYNKAVFKAAGLDPDKPPQTYKDFDAACQKIKAVGKDCIVLGAKDWAFLWTWLELSVQTATPADMKALHDGKQKWSDPAHIAPFRIFADMIKRGWFNQGAAATSVTPDMHDSFVGDKSGFVMTIMSDFMNWKMWGDQMGYAKFGVLKFPVIQPGDIPGVTPGPYAGKFNPYGGIGYNLAKWSQHPQEAVAYIKFVTSPETQTRYLVEGGAMPANKGIDKAAVEKIGSPQLTQILGWVGEGGNFPASPHLYLYAAELDELQRAAQLMLTGSSTAEQAAESMQRVHDAQAQKQ